MGYFVLATVWGFLTGTGALVVAMSVAGEPLRLGPAVAGFLGGAAIVAVLGGLVASMAYRSALGRQG